MIAKKKKKSGSKIQGPKNIELLETQTHTHTQ